MLTEAQLQALAAAIRSETDPAVVAAYAIRNDVALTEWCNAPGTFIVWRTRVTQDEIQLNGFDWVQVDNLSVGKARIWEWLFNNTNRSIDASRANVRAGIDECWKGTAAMLAVRAAVYAHLKRPATHAEQIFATGTGTDADPGLLVLDGSVGINEVSRALNVY
jgi:hypothetical protein